MAYHSARFFSVVLAVPITRLLSHPGILAKSGKGAVSSAGNCRIGAASISRLKSDLFYFISSLCFWAGTYSLRRRPVRACNLQFFPYQGPNRIQFTFR
ncbi:hypothetical protein C8R43DRAFT_1029314 [Mycena crocata]|nr:hypothetical protein C8R43DRAFT_1029314 [Mycena crocata]